MGTVSRLSERASIDTHPPRIDQVESLMRRLTGADEINATGQACDHHLRSGGGRTRALLALDVGRCLGLKPKHCVAVAAAVELLHNASLIHDDIQDRSATRRDQPALWCAFGTEVALIIGDLFLSASYAALQPIVADSADPARLLGHVHRATHRTIRGQNDELTTPFEHCSVLRYERIVGGKSGPLLALPVELALIASNRTHPLECVEAGMQRLATAYQILDDLEDVDADLGFEASGQACLNIVGVLRQGNVDDPKSRALELARLRLEEAARLFSHLPASCVDVLNRLIARLAARLDYR